MSDDKPKPKRPDKKEAIQRKKNLDRTVIKVSLPGLLIAQDGRDAFRAELEQFVENVSRSVNKASLFLNRFLIDRLSNDQSLPDLTDQTLYNQCLNIGSGRCNKPIAGLREVWDASFSNFPPIEKLAGNMQALNYAATTFKTNFLNSLCFAFEVRQKYLLKAWIQDNGLDKGAFRPLECAINGWTCNSPVPVEAVDFVKEQRDFLGLAEEEKISEHWLKTHPQQVIRFYWETMKYLEGMQEKYKDKPHKLPKIFSLSPICSIKRHFVTIDSTVLFHLLRNCELIDKKLKWNDFKGIAIDHFHSLFNVDKLSSKKHTFEKMIETDGVSACVHFTCPKRICTDPEQGKSKKRKRRLGQQDEQKSRDYSGERVIAIDPGRVNIVYAEEKLENGSFKSYKLTRGEYYERCGMIRRNRKTAKWEKTIREEELTYSRHSPKTTDPEQFDAFLKDYISVYDKLWDLKLKKKWAQESFRVYRKKREVLDGFFQSMHKKGERKPVIAYGKGGFASHGRGEVSVPTEYVKDKCRQYFETVEVDEYRTSCVCPCCDALLCKVTKKIQVVDGTVEVREVRGLRRCSSTVCSQVSFKNRDSVGARNILRCLAERERPKSLTRIKGTGALKLENFMLRTGAIGSTAA